MIRGQTRRHNAVQSFFSQVSRLGSKLGFIRFNVLQVGGGAFSVFFPPILAMGTMVHFISFDCSFHGIWGFFYVER